MKSIAADTIISMSSSDIYERCRAKTHRFRNPVEWWIITRGRSPYYLSGYDESRIFPNIMIKIE
jgi:hypothetical protein